MKYFLKPILLGFFLMACVSLWAQENEQGYPHYVTPQEIEDYLSRGVVAPTDRGITSPPNFSNVRAMAEWEEVEAIVISWQGYSSILKQIAAASKNECEVIILSENIGSTQNYLTSNNAGGPSMNLNNISIVPANLNTIWARDYGPHTVYGDDVDDRYLVDWRYNRPRPDDDVTPDVIGDFMNIDVYSNTQAPNDLMSCGGNFMSDGFGTGFSSNLVMEENQGGTTSWGASYPDHTEAEIDAIMNQYLGLETYIKMPMLPYDGIHHIDMHMKLLDEETMLVSKYPQGVADGPQIESNINYVLNNFTTKWGTPFKIVEVPAPPQQSNGNYPDDGGWYLTYTNSVFVNKTIIVPTYYTHYDTTALRIYEEQLPGYNVVGIDCDNSGSAIISALGAIHCITKLVGVEDPLLISYQPLPDTDDDQNDYTVQAYVNHRTGISGATLYWKTDINDPYNAVPMSPMGNNEWTADIPAQSFGSKVYYYVQGTAISGKVQVRPITAPDGYKSFRVINEILGCTDPASCNYNPDATIDDGSCQLQGGCTDPEACNFDPNAQCDDGSCAFENSVSVSLSTDCWGDEVSWTITNESDNIVASVSTNTYGNEQTYLTDLCLGSGCYAFNIADGYGDGMNGSQYGSCSTDGNYTLTDADGNVLVQMGNPNYGTGISHDFCITAEPDVVCNDTTLFVSICDNYDFEGTVLTQSGTYVENLVGTGGCDSLVTLNLTILGITDQCGACIDGGSENPDWNQSCADCHGDPNGSAFLDNCNHCVGGNTGATACVQDCNNEWGGTAYLDNCNDCVSGSTGLEPCEQDCNGVFGGTAFFDNCNNCVGGNTGQSACVQDCNNEWGGTAYLDNCNDCVGGSTGLEPCDQDCNGDFGGTAFIDNCSNCVGGNTGQSACVQDCNNEWGGTAYLDNCNDCVGGSTGLEPCDQDCNGDFGGTAFIDNCNNCVGGNTGQSGCVQDCNNEWGGTAYLDNCNDCVGGSTGLEPCAQDCNGDFGGTAFLDNCNNCVGGNTGSTACVQDCNNEWGGTAYLDNCNDCVGGSTGFDPCAQDCNGDFGGTAFLDNCNNCVGGNTGQSGCVQDCNNEWGGTAYLDNCNDCVGGSIGLEPCDQDCNGDFGGTAFLDNCNNCVGGNTGSTACVQDCNDEWGGTAYLDNCNDCVGGSTGLEPCEQDCNGDYGGTAFLDNCNNCVGGNTGQSGCVQDCNNEWGGTAYLDNCNDCVGGSTGLEPCEQDCNGDFGGTAFIDNCNNCVGGSTGLEPCEQDCNGDFGGTAYLDDCDQCVGGSTGEEPCCVLTLYAAQTPATLGYANGTASVSVLEGEGPFSYQWNDAFYQTSAAAVGLFPGTYSCVVEDAAGCISEIEVTVALFVGVIPTKVSDPYCNAEGFELSEFIACDPVSGADAYRWSFVEEGGVVLPEYTRFNSRYLRLQWVNGIQLGANYSVMVKARVNGNWGEYNLACTIGTATTVPLTEVRSDYHPTNALGQNYSLCDFIIAYPVAGATNYRWRFDSDTDPNNGNEIIYTRGTGNTATRLSWVNGLTPGENYQVAVKGFVSGGWGEYGAAHDVVLALPPATVVRPQFCGETYSPGAYVLSTSVCEASNYQFEFEPVGGGPVHIINSGNYVAFFNNASPSLVAGDYNVRVRVNQQGVLGSFGSACLISISGSGEQEIPDYPMNSQRSDMGNSVGLFPNPSDGTSVRLTAKSLQNSVHSINVHVSNIHGKKLQSLTFAPEGQVISHLLIFDQPLSPGIYIIQVIIDGAAQRTQKMIIDR